MELALLQYSVDICLKAISIQCSREVDRFEFGAWSTTVRHTEDDEYLSDGDWDEDEDEGEGGDHDMDADDDVAMEESVASTSDLH
ncbi:hypothetical protein PC129_g11085 [Phytophthora cactorum]|uniref:Uncharacterized protein n=1 Tax=Phytophthora cactorum TaxID=29920 RepID=A0A329S929_9STRA|nr:hypothetical protein Pcac1_g18588 [Phytophthora cactorum]KAG2820024.1 hypothetical protein PC112_g11939 [Phytophthora cactorum]KAG2825675.1 hypothetical protein PC111_g9284 [Phytophthora cactorum]KAG2856256.1 hypothetical protein PC113_g11732 [Phytophthora cactorum]KAG2903565.1 hypothetical protein PC114_g12213 [Phytophthora cactorum]